MATTLALLAAGRAALADADNHGVREVNLTRLAIGSGLNATNADDDARAALRTQKDTAAVEGDTSVAGHIAVRADYTPSETYAVTEIGLFAKIGAAGAEFLLAYWAAASAAGAAAGAESGVDLVFAGGVAIESAGADIDIAASVAITLQAVPLAATVQQLSNANAAVAWPLRVNRVATLTLDADKTLSATGGADGNVYPIAVTQDATGGLDITYDASDFNFGAAGEPTLSAAGGKTDVLSFLRLGGKLLFMSIVKGF